MQVLSLLALILLALSSAPKATSQITGEHCVRLNGVQLWFKVAGRTKPGRAPLLYLHGGPGYNSYSFEKTVGADLKRKLQVIYLDGRGSGRSERPATHDYAMGTLVEDVEALRKYLKLPQLSIMGQSFGGTIALEYAARYPAHVQKLVILDGAADIPHTFEHWQSEIEEQYPSQWQAALASPAGAAFTQAQKSGTPCAVAKARFMVEMQALGQVDRQQFADHQQFHNQAFRARQKALDDQSELKNTGELGSAYFTPGNDYLCYRFKSFDRLTMPVMVMTGRYDGAIDVEQMRSLAEHIHGAYFDEFTQSAHFPYAEEQTKFVNDLVSFLQK